MDLKLFAISILVLVWVSPSIASAEESVPCNAYRMWRDADELLVALAGVSVLGAKAEAKKQIFTACVRSKTIRATCPVSATSVNRGSSAAQRPSEDTSSTKKPCSAEPSPTELQELYAVALSSIWCPEDAAAKTVVEWWNRWWETLSSSNPFDVRLDEDKFFEYAMQRKAGHYPSKPEVDIEHLLLLAYKGNTVLDPTYKILVPEMPKQVMASSMPQNYYGLLPLAPEARAAPAKQLKIIAEDRRMLISRYSVCDKDTLGLSTLEILLHIAVTATGCGNLSVSRRHAVRWFSLWKMNHEQLFAESRNHVELLLAYVIDRFKGEFSPTAVDLRNERIIAKEYEALRRALQVAQELMEEDSIGD